MQGKTSIKVNLKEDGQTHSSNGNCIICPDPACPGPTSDHIADSDIMKVFLSQPTMLSMIKRLSIPVPSPMTIHY